ncbi:MAG: hypothetical protein MMC23_004654 [Stictis urceolatum]|nr:hypothetical protein [Stictis urceolata]
MADQVLDYHCRNCDLLVVSGPNRWLAISSHSFTSPDSGSLEWKRDACKLNGKQHTGTKQLENCTLDALTCSSCGKRIGLKCIAVKDDELLGNVGKVYLKQPALLAREPGRMAEKTFRIVPDSQASSEETETLTEGPNQIRLTDRSATIQNQPPQGASPVDRNTKFEITAEKVSNPAALLVIIKEHEDIISKLTDSYLKLAHEVRILRANAANTVDTGDSEPTLQASSNASSTITSSLYSSGFGTKSSHTAKRTGTIPSRSDCSGTSSIQVTGSPNLPPMSLSTAKPKPSSSNSTATLKNPILSRLEKQSAPQPSSIGQDTQQYLQENMPPDEDMNDEDYIPASIGTLDSPSLRPSGPSPSPLNPSHQNGQTPVHRPANQALLRPDPLPPVGRFRPTTTYKTPHRTSPYPGVAAAAAAAAGADTPSIASAPASASASITWAPRASTSSNVGDDPDDDIPDWERPDWAGVPSKDGFVRYGPSSNLPSTSRRQSIKRRGVSSTGGPGTNMLGNSNGNGHRHDHGTGPEYRAGDDARLGLDPRPANDTGGRDAHRGNGYDAKRLKFAQGQSGEGARGEKPRDENGYILMPNGKRDGRSLRRKTGDAPRGAGGRSGTRSEEGKGVRGRGGVAGAGAGTGAGAGAGADGVRGKDGDGAGKVNGKEKAVVQRDDTIVEPVVKEEIPTPVGHAKVMGKIFPGWK